MLVVLSIAVGVSAVGTIAGAATLLERNLEAGYANTLPSHAAMFAASAFDPDRVDAVRGRGSPGPRPGSLRTPAVPRRRRP